MPGERMMKCKVNVGKIALLLCNFIFLLSGFCLVLLGCVVLNDAPRILLSQLALEPGTISQPLLYYVALGFIAAGMIISSVALLGCWTTLGPESNCLMAFYIFFVVVLLLVEISVGVVGSLCPQVFGSGMDRDQMVASLMNNYGVPGRDQYTAAVDLAQTIFECCGMQSGSDFDGSRWWKREQEAKHELRVPRSCCFLENTDNRNAFLDPVPVNITLCQAKTNARYRHGRHVKGCIDQLDAWFKDHVTIFLIIGSALIVVQLSVLLCAIIVCLRRKSKRSASDEEESADDGSRWPPSSSKAKKAGGCENGFERDANGLPIASSASSEPSRPSNPRRTNYSFGNSNYVDTEGRAKAPRALSPPLLPPPSSSSSSSAIPFLRSNLDANRNESESGYGRQRETKFHEQQQSGRAAEFYKTHNSATGNEYQYHEAMRHYYRKNNDLGGFVGNGNELGT